MPVVSERTMDRIAAQAELNRTYLVLMATAGVLSAVALLTNSIPVLIGAMVIAPALGPLALVAFAIADGKSRLAFRGLGGGGGRACRFNRLCDAYDGDHESDERPAA